MLFIQSACLCCCIIMDNVNIEGVCYHTLSMFVSVLLCQSCFDAEDHSQRTVALASVIHWLLDFHGAQNV